MKMFDDETTVTMTSISPAVLMTMMAVLMIMLAMTMTAHELNLDC